MDATDIKKRKPRQTRNTPSFHYRNRFALGVLAAGSTLFGLWSLTPIFRHANSKMLQQIEPTAEETERKALFELLPIPRTSNSIQETIDERDRLFTER